jgi:hypothetical protein
MSNARDIPQERLAEYGELFERALLGRERRPDRVVLTFRGDQRTRTQVEDLVGREHACCPFVDYRVESSGDELRWVTTTVATGGQRATVNVILDGFYALPDPAKAPSRAAPVRAQSQAAGQPA